MANENIERRDWVFEDDDALVIEKRSDGRPVISGYAVKWNSLSVDMGGFRERFLPGAFDKVLSRSYKKADPIALFNHDPSIVLGRASSGTLEVKADDKGLAYRIFPPTTRADIVELVERGDVRGASFAFTVDPKGEAWGPDDNGKPLRSISEASGLFDVSVVVNPAYPASTTSVARRSLEQWLASQEQEPVVPEPIAVRRGLLPAAAASMRLTAAILRSKAC